jgi:hypothetical protein
MPILQLTQALTQSLPPCPDGKSRIEYAILPLKGYTSKSGLLAVTLAPITCATKMMMVKRVIKR